MRKLKIAFYYGDIAAIKADAYVVPQYPHCADETGVAARIINTDCAMEIDWYNYCASRSPYPFGYAMTSATERTKVGYIIHVVTKGMPFDSLEGAFLAIQSATFNALAEAERHGIASLAIPALGTGDAEPLSFLLSGRAMSGAIVSFIKSRLYSGIVQSVTIPIYKSRKSYDLFTQGARQYEPYVRSNVLMDVRDGINDFMSKLHTKN